MTLTAVMGIFCCCFVGLGGGFVCLFVLFFTVTGFEGGYGGVCICKVSVGAVQRPLSLK